MRNYELFIILTPYISPATMPIISSHSHHLTTDLVLVTCLYLLCSLTNADLNESTVARYLSVESTMMVFWVS